MEKEREKHGYVMMQKGSRKIVRGRMVERSACQLTISHFTYLIDLDGLTL